MKLKSFGLIEAMIATAIIIVFISAMSLLTVKASRSTEYSQHSQTAQKIADDYVERFKLLRDAGRISYDSKEDGGQLIPVECFSTDNAIPCRQKIVDTFYLNQFPFFDMVSDKKIGNYYLIKTDYLKKEYPEDFFRIKTQMEKTDCRSNQPHQFESDKCFNLSLEITWPEKNQTGKYQFKEYLTQIP